MKRGLRGLALMAIMSSGCATTQRSHTYTTEVVMRRSGAPQQYVVEFEVSRTPHGANDPLNARDTLSAQTMTVKAGQEAETRVCDEKENNGVFCRALVKADGAGVNAATRVVVKVDGRETLNSAQDMTLRDVRPIALPAGCMRPEAGSPQIRSEPATSSAPSEWTEVGEFKWAAATILPGMTKEQVLSQVEKTGRQLGIHRPSAECGRQGRTLGS